VRRLPFLCLVITLMQAPPAAQSHLVWMPKRFVQTSFSYINARRGCLTTCRSRTGSFTLQVSEQHL
jgi:hypothetical protein